MFTTWGILTEKEAGERLDANHGVIMALQETAELMGNTRNLRGFKATAKRLRKLRKENYRLAVKAIKLYWHEK